jgi:hypothetical protein
MPKTSQLDALEKLAATIAAELLAGGDQLCIHTKKGKLAGTWFKSNLTNCISNLLHQHIELTK